MSGFKAGDEVMRLHPHSTFDKIRQLGFELRFRIEIEEEFPDIKELLVEVRLNEEVIATAEFMDDAGEKYAHCQNVKVNLECRRQGIATVMYVFAEKVFGRCLSNFWGDDPKQAPAAKALWANSNRPFGHPENTAEN